MYKYLFPALFYVVAAAPLGCLNKTQLAEHSFGPIHKTTSKASAASVISMGRDDDDGKAKKWHIGGGDPP